MNLRYSPPAGGRGHRSRALVEIVFQFFCLLKKFSVNSDTMSVSAALITALFIIGPSTTIVCGEVIEVLLVLVEGPGNATAEAGALAVEHVNSNEDILPNDQLQVIPRYLKVRVRELKSYEELCVQLM